MLARRDVFDRLGPLDEKRLSTREHIDLSLGVLQAGGTIYFEPRSIVAYVPPPPLERTDLRFFLLRWSDAWAQASGEHFERKWRLSLDGKRRTIIQKRRMLALRAVRQLQRATGPRASRWLEDHALLPLEGAANRLHVWWQWDRRQRQAAVRPAP